MPSVRSILAVSALLTATAAGAEPIRVTGVILQDSDRGVKDARVELVPAYRSAADEARWLQEGKEPEPVASGRTDADGFFEILAPESGAYKMRVRAEGFLPEEHPLVPLVQDVGLVPTTLNPLRPLAARVVDAAGRPLAGVRVRPDSQERMPSWSRRTWQWQNARSASGADGRVTIPSTESAQWQNLLLALSPRFLGQSVTVSTGATPPVVLRLVQGPTVRLEARGAEGKPVAGALVRWRDWPISVTGPGGRLEVAVPAEGALRIESPDGWQARLGDLPKGARPANVLPPLVPVQLAAPRLVSGKVADAASGSPISGALVWIAGERLTAPAVRSGPDGAFQLAVPGGEDVKVQAAAAGRRMSEARFVPRGQTGPLVLQLEAAVRVQGVVVDSAGRPVPHAMVMLAPAPERIPAPMPEGLLVWSRADGSFELSGLPYRGSFEAGAQRSGYVPATASFGTPGPGQPVKPLRIVLGEGQSLAGRVVDEGGRPVAGADLVLMVREGQIPRSHSTGTSDAEGRFEIRHLAPGRADLWVRRTGFALAYRSGIEIPAGQPRVDAGTIELKAGAVVEGRVVDERGRPVEGAEVETQPDAGGDFWELALAEGPDASRRTGPDGLFRIPDLKPGSRVSLSVRHPAYVNASVPGVEAPTAEPLRVELKAARSLTGRVVGPEGEPVAGATVIRIQMSQLMGGFSMDNSGFTSDPDGRFQISGLSPGPVDLQVRARGFQTRQVEGIPVPQEGDLEIRLEKGTTIKARVLSKDGEPVSDASVNASPVGDTGKTREGRMMFWMDLRDRTDEDGMSLVELPGPGRYRISAWAAGRRAAVEIEAGPGVTPVEIRFPRGVAVSGRVVDGQGRGLGLVSLALANAETGQGVHAISGADGAFTFEDVTDGTLQLHAERSGYRPPPEPVEVNVAGRDVGGLELRLEKRQQGQASLSGQITGLTPEELRSIRVNAWPEDAPPTRAQVDEDGRYRVQGLEGGGLYRVQAITMTGREAEGQVQIPEGAAEATLDLEFKGRSLAGRVLVDGAPLSGGEVWLLSAQTFAGQARTAYDGTFRLSIPAPGRYEAFVLARGSIGSLQPLEVREDDREVTIEVQTQILNGQVTSPSGPVADALIAVQGLLKAPAGEFSLPTLRSGEDGAFEMRVAPGTYRLKVTREGLAPQEVTVQVGAGGPARVEVVMKATP